MKPNQIAAIKKLQAALLSVKRAGLVIVGIDDALFVSVDDDELEIESNERSCCEAILERNNTGHEDTDSIKHYGAYRDSGGA